MALLLEELNDLYTVVGDEIDYIGLTNKKKEKEKSNILSRNAVLC